MIFNLQAGEVKTLPILSDKYPEDITVKQGENAVFSAVIDEDGIPTEYTYQWYVNDSLVSDATTAVYTRKTDEDSGIYTVYCEITNKAGTVKTRTAQLEVDVLPTLDSTKPANATIGVGKSVTLSVAISKHGYPKTYTYQWYKNGSKISGATSNSYVFVASAVGTTTFYCEVTNSAGTVKSRTATLTAVLYLLNDGQINTNVAGDIVGEAGKANKYSETHSVAPGIAKQGSQIRIRQDPGENSGYVYFTKKINLTSYSAVSIDVYSDVPASNASGPTFLCWKSLPHYWSEDAVVHRSVNTGGVRKNVGSDISSLSGEYYLGFGIGSSEKETNTIWLYNIILK